MAKAEELFDGRIDKYTRSARVPYLATDVADEAAAFAAVLAAAPTAIGSLTRRYPETAKRINLTTWVVNVPYELKQWNANPDSRFSFDTSGGTTHITQSRETINRYGPDKANLNEVIGYDGERVVGTDIVTPVYNFGETHFFADTDVDNDYKTVLRNLTGRTNNASFKGFSQGEVLFLGAAGSRQGDDSDDKWEITFNFASSQNVTGQSVGSITGIDKWGWEYLWVQYSDDEITDDAGKKSIGSVPIAVYIERVYNSGDFSTLDIGTV